MVSSKPSNHDATENHGQTMMADAMVSELEREAGEPESALRVSESGRSAPGLDPSVESALGRTASDPDLPVRR
ncbi:MAG: hypothetical protein NDI90_21100 [Nitrospira sp. BO4]|jgi:hypothetical protein|nr:hypothetical protein [Nitrospira sp. BO4]